MDTYRHIAVLCSNDVYYVRLKHFRLEELDIAQLGDEVLGMCARTGCRNLALCIGPQTPSCLYSVFLAKLVSIRNGLQRMGGEMILCEVGPIAYSAFEVCKLDNEFTFLPDFNAAVRYFNS